MRWIIILFLVTLFDTGIGWSQRSGALPDFATLQYAGSIGYVSGGLGYNLSKRASVSLHYGYVPENRGGKLNIVAAKLLFNTYSLRISDNLLFEPLRAGAMMSYHFGREFGSRWPHRYPDGYYWWKTSVRAHLVTQTSLTIRLKNKGIHSLTGYIDLNTNELYLISYIQNRHSLSFRDIIKVGYGVRANF